jgi:hypothetical protein
MPTSIALDIDGRSTSAPQPSALQKRLANPTMARFSDAGFAVVVCTRLIEVELRDYFEKYFSCNPSEELGHSEALR